MKVAPELQVDDLVEMRHDIMRAATRFHVEARSRIRMRMECDVNDAVCVALGVACSQRGDQVFAAKDNGLLSTTHPIRFAQDERWALLLLESANEKYEIVRFKGGYRKFSVRFVKVRHQWLYVASGETIAMAASWAWLRYRAKHDPVLKKHLKGALVP